MTKTTGVRLTDAHFTKLDQMAKAIGVNSRNAVIVQLIDNAQVEERTVVQATAVLSEKKNRYGAQNLTGSSTTAVGV